MSRTRRTQKQLLPVQLDAGRAHPTTDEVLFVFLAPGFVGPVALLYENSVAAPAGLTVHAPDGPAPVGEVALVGAGITHDGAALRGARAVAEGLGVSPDALLGAMYADLDGEQVLTAVAATTPDALLHRYNLALAQADLLAATSPFPPIADYGFLSDTETTALVASKNQSRRQP